MAVAEYPHTVTTLKNSYFRKLENWLKHDMTGAREQYFVLSTSWEGGGEEFKHHSVQENALDLHLQQINQH